MSIIQQFLRDHAISEVEALIADMSGVARGKIMPAEKYAEDEGMRLPEGIFLQTVTGEWPSDDSVINPSEIDIDLVGDPNTIRVVPWTAEPTAQVIHDCFYDDGRVVPLAPRYLLRRILERRCTLIDYERIVEFCRTYMPNALSKVELYTGKEPIFDAYGIEFEIERALQRERGRGQGGRRGRLGGGNDGRHHGQFAQDRRHHLGHRRHRVPDQHPGAERRSGGRSRR